MKPIEIEEPHLLTTIHTPTQFSAYAGNSYLSTLERRARAVSDESIIGRPRFDSTNYPSPSRTPAMGGFRIDTSDDDLFRNQRSRVNTGDPLINDTADLHKDFDLSGPRHMTPLTSE